MKNICTTGTTTQPHLMRGLAMAPSRTRTSPRLALGSRVAPWLARFWLSRHTCLNVIFTAALCQEALFIVCEREKRAYGRATLGRCDSLSERARHAARPDALGFSPIKWRSSLFSLSTTVSCTLKCLVNHCLHSTEAAKMLIKSKSSPTCHARMMDFFSPCSRFFPPH